MITAREVHVRSVSPERMRRLIDPDDLRRFEAGLEVGRSLLAGRELWNVNSNASSGGVAEMLRSWVGLAKGLGVGMRWLTISGTPDFFTVTKRLHNFLHGDPGDGGELGEAERALYERVCGASAETVIASMGLRDVVFLHDPQTAGLVPRITESGRTVVWRCHIGADEANEYTRAGWGFLEPYVAEADACVFSREEYVPPFCRALLTAIVPPSIDAISPKNQDLKATTVQAILRHVGLLVDGNPQTALPVYTLPDGRTERVKHKCAVTSAGSLPDTESTVVTQVSRWDRLKDPAGVMRGFALVASNGVDAHLILAGPGLDAVVDDPEAVEVFEEVEREWRRLAPWLQSRVHLACLPMQDLDENAVIVNALQRQATVIAQKSLKEGFGLTVTEAMWKARPVVASEIGGIRDQIDNGVTGILVRDPLDLEEFAAAMLELLNAPARARQIGLAGRESVRKGFLENRHSLQYVELLRRLLA